MENNFLWDIIAMTFICPISHLFITCNKTNYRKLLKNTECMK